MKLTEREREVTLRALRREAGVQLNGASMPGRSEADIKTLGDEARLINGVADKIETAGVNVATLSAEAHAVVCGLVQDDEDVASAGIFAPVEVWAELRAAFPREDFDAWASEPDRYDPDAGT